MFGISANGKTYEIKEELKNKGFKWMNDNYLGNSWIKEVETVEEAKETIRDLNQHKGVLTDFGYIEKRVFYSGKEFAEFRGLWNEEIEREIYNFKKENGFV